MLLIYFVSIWNIVTHLIYKYIISNNHKKSVMKVQNEFKTMKE